MSNSNLPRFRLALRSVLAVAIAMAASSFVVMRFSRMKLAALPSAAVPNPVTDVSLTPASGQQTAIFSGGCFWGMAAIFEHVKGVSAVVAGYSGGSATTAHYEQVSAGGTGHAESIQITYDPTQVSYGQLLKVFFSVAHDPTQLNRQGNDVGTQYRSDIFYTNEQQAQTAKAYIKQLNQAHVFNQPIVTQVNPLTAFYAAEDYHQNYVDRNPDNAYVVSVELPKVEQFRNSFPDLYKP
ncbi:MAG: peptide-methionine (S)-S-oxide reductase MsrA [Thermosynechococcaceae cyanobacterium]